MHRASVQFHQFMHKRESNACTLVSAGAGVLDSMKPLKDPFLFLLRNANTGVLNRKLNRTVFSFHRDGDSAFKRELEGV